jgi:hypothetical protein
MWILSFKFVKDILQHYSAIQSNEYVGNSDVIKILHGKVWVKSDVIISYATLEKHILQSIMAVMLQALITHIPISARLDRLYPCIIYSTS